MEQQLNVDEIEDSSLLDCYRIALDFGMPAALRAYEKLSFETQHKHNGSSVDNDQSIPGYNFIKSQS